MSKLASGTSDEEIIMSLLHGHLPGRRAETEFFSRYQYFIKEGIKKYRLSENEAFDAYSDSILAIVDNIRKGAFQGRSSLKTYTFQVFQNKCVDLVRQKTTIKNRVHQTVVLSDFLFSLSDATKSILHRLSEQTDLEALERLVASLGDKCKDLLTFFAQGYSDKEMAKNMGYKTADVVKTSRLRCLEKLRQVYK